MCELRSLDIVLVAPTDGRHLEGNLASASIAIENHATVKHKCGPFHGHGIIHGVPVDVPESEVVLCSKGVSERASEISNQI